MPIVSRFFGITVRMYYVDHEPPHFHAFYGDHEAIFSIDTLEVLRGDLPIRARSFVLEWAAMHRYELKLDWRLAQRGRRIRAIAPLI